MQGTRSDMNWQDLGTNADKQALLTHWQTLARFRQAHPAIGAGKQTTAKTNKYYAFSRELDGDKVMVIWAGE